MAINAIKRIVEMWRRATISFFKGNFYPTPYIKKEREADECKCNGKKRIAFIDLAKGVCILLVVIFHSPHISLNFPGLAAMRMPLYFILSGLFFKDYGGFFQLLEKKINKIVIPFLFFLIVDFVWQWIAKGTAKIELLTSLWTDGQSIHNIPTWFLVALFFSNLIFCLVQRSTRQPIAIATIVAALGLSGSVLTCNGIYLPFYLTQAINGLPFFYLGFVARQLPLLYPNRFDRYSTPIAIGLIAACYGLCTAVGDTPHLDFFQNRFISSPLLFYPIAVCMVTALLLLCKVIKWLPVVSYIGRYSIIVLGLHQMLIFQLKWARIPLTSVKLHGVGLCLTVIGICWFAIPVLCSLLPSLTAQKDRFRLPKIGHIRFRAHLMRFQRRLS